MKLDSSFRIAACRHKIPSNEYPFIIRIEGEIDRLSEDSIFLYA